MSFWAKLNPVNWFRGTLKEASQSDIYGTPVSDYELNTWNGRPLTPVWGPELFPDKLQTIRTLQELNRVRHVSRYLYERNPNASGGINGMGRYVVGCGSAQEVQSTDPDKEAPPALAKAVTALLDEFKKASRWKIIEREIYRRYLTDGECFIELTPMDDGITAVKFVEPDSIVPPEGQSFEGPWSWGILTRPDRPGVPVAYNVRDYSTNTERRVPAQFIFHLKRGTNLNQKRGLPALTACIDELQGGNKLRYASREGEKVRASIAYVRQFAQAPATAIQSLQSAQASGTFQRSTPNGTQDVTYQQIEPGTVQDIPEGLEYQPPPPSPNSEAAAMSVKLSLEATAAALEAPYWLISGDSTASSYASSLTAESPFIKLVEGEQSVLSEYVDDVLTAVIEIAAEQERDNIPMDVLDQIDLHVNYTVPVVRQKLDEAHRNEILRKAKIKSPQTISAEEGLDYEKEQANFVAAGPSPEEQAAQQEADLAAKQPQTAGGQMKRDQGSEA
ncbi:Phage portal protein, lambda family [Gemmata sp. SH-PL17]|uniref:phage portal protein n=1 Tax=Gemmata sp. SH-PL17 TaxID=1630693 RepID=UPI00078CD6D0|nr:phage portal protein [Gemmata sp. SH-PL17]AMV27360.1 Phage portal protein, lambda family [Gemmata sp. SH-PL17]